MTAKRASCAALAIVALGLAPAALADTTVLRDPAGDTPDPTFARGQYDIRRASAGHAGRRRLRHTVQMHRKPSPSVALVFVNVGRRHYLVDFVGVWNARTHEKTGKVRTRRRGKRIAFTFSRRAIGNPRAYRWKAASVIGGHFDGGTPDEVPNKGYRRHRIRRR